MKYTDLNEIFAEITALEININEQLIELLGEYKTKLAIMGIYLTNDLCSGYGQDFRLDDVEVREGDKCYLSIISSPRKISIILDGLHSYYKIDENICQYDSITDDISVIIMVMNTAFERVLSRL